MPLPYKRRWFYDLDKNHNGTFAVNCSGIPIDKTTITNFRFEIASPVMSKLLHGLFNKSLHLMQPAAAQVSSIVKQPMSSETKHRRVEKAWRFRDRESTSSQSLYTILITIQAIIIAVFSVLSNMQNAHVSAVMLSVVFILSATTLIILGILSAYSRDLDHRRACYFETLLKPDSERPADFNEGQEDYNWKSDNKKYMKRRQPLEWAATIFMIANLLFLWLTIHHEPPF